MRRESDKANSEIAAYIKNNMDTPFEWGVFDCCVFASEIIKIKTGLDLYAPYRGKYSDVNGAIEIQKGIGLVSDVMDKHFKQIDVNLARRGDILEFDNMTMGVYFNQKIGLTKRGVAPVSNKIKRVWALWLPQ